MSSPTPQAALLALLRVTPVQPPAIERLLDGMTHVERVAAVRALGRPEQRALYEAVAGFRPLQLMPEFHEGEEEREKAKLERLAPAIEAALARREPAREAPETVLKPVLAF